MSTRSVASHTSTTPHPTPPLPHPCRHPHISTIPSYPSATHPHIATPPSPPGLSSAAAKDAPRADIESRLRFAGFAVFATPLKEGSEPALRHLRDAALQLVMITGDAPLTACHVARQTHIVERQVLILGHKAVSADAGASASDAVPSVTTTSTTTTTAVTNTRTATLTNTTTPSRTSHAPGGPSRPRSTSADSDDRMRRATGRCVRSPIRGLSIDPPTGDTGWTSLRMRRR